MSIADRWVRNRPPERVLANGRAALPDSKLLTRFARTGAAKLQAAM